MLGVQCNSSSGKLKEQVLKIKPKWIAQGEKLYHSQMRLGSSGYCPEDCSILGAPYNKIYRWYLKVFSLEISCFLDMFSI